MRVYFGLVSVMFFAGALWLVVRRWSLVANGITIRGRVVGDEKRSAENSGYCLPVVAFTYLPKPCLSFALGRCSATCRASRCLTPRCIEIATAGFARFRDPVSSNVRPHSWR